MNKIKYGDTVIITDGEFKGNTGEIVSKVNYISCTVMTDKGTIIANVSDVAPYTPAPDMLAIPDDHVWPETSDNEVVTVDEPTLEGLFPKEQCGNVSIDQELEDAAKEWKNQLLFLDSSLEDMADMLVNSWKSGANWKSEQMANSAMKFAEWLDKGNWPAATKESKSFTQLYEQWNQNSK